MTAPVLELSDVSKDYHGLRPLRISRLSLAAGERAAILGLDAAAAEVFVNLVTGATLPDRGEIRVFGRSTAAISDSADWLAVVDRFGMISRRAVLLDALTVVQNLAMPFTLRVEPPAADIRERAVALAGEVGLPGGSIDRPVSELDPTGVARVRLARALALDPAILIVEHATTDLPQEDVAPFGIRCRDVATERAAAVVALTADRRFAEAIAGQYVTLDPGSGRLEQPGWLRRLRQG